MVVFISGGASGLGEAITKALAQGGRHTVYFSYNRSLERAKELEAKFENCKGFKCDFRLPEEVTSLCRKIKELNPDVLVNNAYAGDFIQTHFHALEPPVFFSEFKNNVQPTLEITAEAIKTFRAKKRGLIVTILSSVLETQAPIGSSVYTANKAYLREMAKCWELENKKFGIVSRTLSPSFMHTGLTKNLDERVLEEMITKSPNGKLTSVEEVAKQVKELVEKFQSDHT